MFLILGGHVVFIILQNIWNFRGCERGGWVLLPHNLKHQPERWPPGQYTEYPVAAQGLAQQALLGGGSGIESGSSSIVEIVDEEKGTFIIKDWSDYPDDYVPVPDQNKVWTFLEGDEYNSARDSANIFNRNMRAADPYYANNGLEIHEIEPVKMGGSPTDINNKTAIQSQVHRRYVTPWWNKIRDEVKKGLN